MVIVVFRLTNLAMAVLFAGGTIVQLNDPDPMLWMAIYASACAVTVLRAVRVTVPVVVPVAVGVVALVWGMTVAAARPEFEVYRQMFGAWEMDSAAVEEAREATGLFLIAGWMAVLSWTGRSGKGVGRHPSKTEWREDVHIRRNA